MPTMAPVTKDCLFSKALSNPVLIKGRYVRVLFSLNALEYERSVLVSLNNAKILPKYRVNEIRLMYLSSLWSHDSFKKEKKFNDTNDIFCLKINNNENPIQQLILVT